MKKDLELPSSFNVVPLFPASSSQPTMKKVPTPASAPTSIRFYNYQYHGSIQQFNPIERKYKYDDQVEILFEVQRFSLYKTIFKNNNDVDNFI
ncbi:unnamed protein product [Rotaria magnacalcarata]|uniref:Uncharacterized protein n=1 Tax=Rotaria magnacalcarata TaxID=392030 RepID=A0A820D618_9BILA|nr:unnamed protein product [Rotaria magnacalcarata]